MLSIALRVVDAPTRRTLSQFWSSKIRLTTYLNYVKFADLLTLRL